MTNLNYIIRGVTLLTDAIAPATIIFLILAMAAYVIRKKENHITPQQYICGYILSVYVVSIGFVTGVVNFSSWQWSQQFSFNLVPLVHNSWQLMLLNVMLFMPLGILLPLTFRKAHWTFRRVILVTFATTSLIEFVQLMLAGREGDIDDIIANTFGGILGFLIYKGFREMVARCPKILKEIMRLPVAFSVLALLWSLPIRRLCLGDIVLTNLMIPTWSGNTAHSFSMSGIHYTLLYAMILLVPVCIIAFRFNSGRKRNINLVISFGTTAMIGIIFVCQTIIH